MSRYEKFLLFLVVIGSVLAVCGIGYSLMQKHYKPIKGITFQEASEYGRQNPAREIMNSVRESDKKFRQFLFDRAVATLAVLCIMEGVGVSDQDFYCRRYRNKILFIEPGSRCWYMYTPPQNPIDMRYFYGRW